MTPERLEAIAEQLNSLSCFCGSHDTGERLRDISAELEGLAREVGGPAAACGGSGSTHSGAASPEESSAASPSRGHAPREFTILLGGTLLSAPHYVGTAWSGTDYTELNAIRVREVR